MAKLFYSAIDLKQNQLQRAVIHNTSAPAGTALKGQMYYDTDDDILKYYSALDGGAWISVTANTNTQDDTDLGETLAVNSYTITSSTGASLSMSAADETNWGIMTDDHVTAIGLNTDKVTNVTTNLDITGTDGARTITSSDGTGALIPIATTSVSGLMTPTMFDANADITNKANKASPAFTGDITHIDESPLYVMTDTSDDVTGPVFRFEKNPVTANEADPNDSIGMFSWLGYNAVDVAHEYASLEVLSTTTTTDGERGRMDFAVMAGGTLTRGLRIGGTAADGIIDIELGAGTTSTVTIPGNLVVTGTTITQNETISVVENNTILFEGTLSDDHETKLTVEGPTADRTITLPDATGTVALSNGASPGSIDIDTNVLSGATVISDLDLNVTTDAQGIVTSAVGAVSTRDLTLSDLGYGGDTNANLYVHPTTAGNKHVPTGGGAGEFLKYSSSGTAVWATPSYTTNVNTQLNAAKQLIEVASVNATTKRAQITHGFSGGAMAVTLYETSDASGNSTYPWNEVSATVSHASATVLHVSFDTLPTNDIMAVMVQADGTASSIAYPTS